MKKNIGILVLALVSTFLSCNAQQIQTRDVQAFRKIEASGTVNVYFTQSDTASLTVKADRDDLEDVETRFENGVLIISNKGRVTDPIRVYVKNPVLNSIETSGLADVKILQTLKTDSLEFVVSGSSDLNGKVEASKVSCLLSGAGDLSLSGSTENLTANVSSAASLKAYNLVSKNANVVTTGAASAKVFVSEKLVANASGASDIKVKGEPKEVAAESTTASSITRIKELSANQNGAAKDTVVYDFKNKRVLVVQKGNGDTDFNFDFEDEGFKHWRGFALAVNGYVTPSREFTLPKAQQYMEVDYARSFNLQFNFMERQFNIYKNYVKIVTGMGFDYHSYALANKTTLDPDSSYTGGVIDSTGTLSYRKNRFRATYLQVPLLLEFNTSDKSYESYHIAIGVIGQYLITSRTRQILKSDDAEFTKVRKDSYNLAPFALKAHISVGYKDFQVFGEYGLTPLFQSGKGPELNPIALGVRWSFS